MVRIDNFLFGYRKITVPHNKLSDISSRLLRCGISTTLTSDGCFAVRERDAEKVRQILSDIEYSESELLGIRGKFDRLRYKGAIFAAVIISLVLAVLSSCTVWDIRVDGNERIPDAAVVDALDRCGFSIGDLWLLRDRSVIESAVLGSSPDIAWININRRGSVAYVRVVEKEQNGTDYVGVDEGYSNIVASVDCVIEEITVHRGKAVVKAGDTVKRGDLLIAGILPGDNGDFCHAEGSIIGRISDTVTVTVARDHTVKTRSGEKLLSYSIKFFKLNANIFKRYGNLQTECDIIEEISTFSLLGRCRLPIETKATYMTEYTYSSASYSDTELVNIASARLNRTTVSRLALSTLIRIRTYGEFTEEGYTMSNDIIFTAEVGCDSPFTAE